MVFEEYLTEMKKQIISGITGSPPDTIPTRGNLICATENHCDNFSAMLVFLYVIVCGFMPGQTPQWEKMSVCRPGTRRHRCIPSLSVMQGGQKHRLWTHSPAVCLKEDDASAQASK
jgi:hypothetical protein